MGNKRLIIGSSEYGINDEDADQVLKDVKVALERGTVAEVAVRDKNGRQLTVLVNGKSTQAVALDLDVDGRPSEIS